MPSTDELAEQIGVLVRGGDSPDSAARRLAQLVPADEVKLALAEFRRQAGRIRSLKDPAGIIDEQRIESWYLGPRDGDRFWPALVSHLKKKGRADDQLAALDNASTKVVSLLRHPGAGAIQTRGLVIGYVQSGKTENFTAVVSKAADVGYRFFIVLSGLNNALRNQTQGRLEKDLVALNPEHWISVTNGTTDFRETINVNAFLTEHQQGRVLGVLKKNKYRLTRLLNWLRGARPEVLQGCPVLLIDDEADQASPNTARELADRSDINRCLVDILKVLPKAAYVGYTATPFANLLIDAKSTDAPDDLYPRDFIIGLPRPASYFGPERVFGREPLNWQEGDEGVDGLPIIRTIEVKEVPLLRPENRNDREAFKPKVPASLKEALWFFLLATACRWVRGQWSEHSSMLVHTTEYVVVHRRLEVVLLDEIKALRSGIASKDQALLAKLEKLWNDEIERVDPKLLGQVACQFSELLPKLGDVAKALDVRIEHGGSATRVDYPDVDKAIQGRCYVVIGGNVLSRGLTIEGLSVSYFVRSASAYDTLLQMGRWFGYRPGYEDLQRLWMPDDLVGYFNHMALVEKEIRLQLQRYENGTTTPLQYAVKIRSHPFLAITSKLKMQRAVRTTMSFAGQAPQTLVFNHKDTDWLRKNFNAAANLVEGIRKAGASGRSIQNRPNWLVNDIDVSLVKQFLNGYEIHPAHVEFKRGLVLSYIAAQNSQGRLLKWNVGIVGRGDERFKTIDFGHEVVRPLINRSRHSRDKVNADIKALMSGLDVVADVDRPDVELESMERGEAMRLRDQLVPDRGLLLLYPISKDSKPQLQKSKERSPLGAEEHMIGLAMVFPDPDDGTPQEYYTADLPDVPKDEVEIEEDSDE